MSFPSLSLPAQLPPELRRELEQVLALTTAWMQQEHNDDGTHAAITTTGTVMERGRTKPMGEWTDVPYLATNFTGAAAMTFTVQATDQVSYQYMLIGKTMWVNCYIDTASIGGVVAAALFVAIPGGFVAAKSKGTGTYLLDNGTPVPAYCRVTAGARQIEIGRVDAANFTASANLTYIRVSFEFEVR
jgi:hypothetical protein